MRESFSLVQNILLSEVIHRLKFYPKPGTNVFPAGVIPLGKNAIWFGVLIADAGGNPIFNEDNGRVEVLRAVTFFELVLGLHRVPGYTFQLSILENVSKEAQASICLCFDAFPNFRK